MGNILTSTKLPTTCLRVRLARSITFNSPTVFPTLRTLQRVNIHFTTSSFNANCSYLRRLGYYPVDALGVSRSFITKLTGSRHSRAVIHAIVRLTRKLNVRMITRNIRASTDLSLLQRTSYSAKRNFLFTGPVPTTTFTIFIDR